MASDPNQSLITLVNKIKSNIDYNPLDLIQSLMEDYPIENIRTLDDSPFYHSILYFGCRKCNLDVIHFALGLGIDVITPKYLISAFNNSSREMIELFLGMGADFRDLDYQSLQRFIYGSKSMDSIFLAIEYGLDIKRFGSDLLMLTTGLSDLKALKVFVDLGLSMDNSLVKSNAIETSSIEFLELMTELGANFFEEGLDAILKAAVARRINVVRYLIGLGIRVPDSEDFFWKVINSSNLEILKLLVENGLDLCKEYVLKQCIGIPMEGLVEYVFEVASKRSYAFTFEDLNRSLCKAVDFSDLRVIKLLESNGADIYSNNNYCIKEATSMRRTLHPSTKSYEVTCYLLDKTGFDLNDSSIFPHIIDEINNGESIIDSGDITFLKERGFKLEPYVLKLLIGSIERDRLGTFKLIVSIYHSSLSREDFKIIGDHPHIRRLMLEYLKEVIRENGYGF